MTPTKTKSKRKKAEAEIQSRYASLSGTLTERSRRLFAGCEALSFGYGGIEAVIRATGLSKETVRRGLQECKAIEAGQAPSLPVQRRRQPGGGGKPLAETCCWQHWIRWSSQPHVAIPNRPCCGRRAVNGT